MKLKKLVLYEIILNVNFSANLESYPVLFPGHTAFFVVVTEHEVFAADIKLSWGGR